MKTTAELRRLAHPADARGTRARIAVLPFDDLTPDGPAASVADTLMALVISNLAARDGISVVSRRSSLRYRDARAALADIARDLDASRIVAGGRRAGRRG
jgi:TolB-like protein